MPAQVEIYAEGEDAYKFLFIAKGGGSANKAFLFQATPSILTHDRMTAFLKEKMLTLGTAACPPYHLAIVHRRHLGRDDDEDREARLDQVSRQPADARERGRPRVPRSRDGGRGAEDDAEPRRRRAVRRQVFLPRRARDPPAAAWRERCRSGSACRARPTGRRSARSRATACSSRSWSTIRRSICPRSTSQPRRRGGADRPQPADAGDSGDAVALSGEDAALALRPDDRGARSRARQAARAAGKRAGAARLHQEPSGLLRRAGEDARGLRVGRVRPDHRGTDGFVRRCVPGGGRLDGDGGEGQSRGRGARGLQEARRLLSRARSAARRRTSPSTASRRSRRWNIPSSAWRRSGASRWSTSRPSS